MATLPDIRAEILSILEKHDVRLVVVGPGTEEYEEYIEVQLLTNGLVGSIRLY